MSGKVMTKVVAALIESKSPAADAAGLFARQLVPWSARDSAGAGARPQFAGRYRHPAQQGAVLAYAGALQAGCAGVLYSPAPRRRPGQHLRAAA